MKRLSLQDIYPEVSGQIPAAPLIRIQHTTCEANPTNNGTKSSSGFENIFLVVIILGGVALVAIAINNEMDRRKKTAADIH